MKMSFEIEGKNKKELAEGLRAHLALFNESDEERDDIDMSALKEKKGRPAKTVSDDEDEDFGKKKMSKKDLEEEDDDVEAAADDEGEEDNGNDDDTKDEPGVTFQELRAAINKYGEKKPADMRAILLSFNLKSPKELSSKGAEKYYDVIYRKVMSKLKALKKSA